MIEWKLITSDDELPKEAILVANRNGYEHLVHLLDRWYVEDGSQLFRVEYPSKQFTHWSEINIPK